MRYKILHGTYLVSKPKVTNLYNFRFVLMLGCWLVFTSEGVRVEAIRKNADDSVKIKNLLEL